MGARLKNVGTIVGIIVGKKPANRRHATIFADDLFIASRVFLIKGFPRNRRHAYREKERKSVSIYTAIKLPTICVLRVLS